jgi:DNA-binding transcriptional ArsR family regulator
MAVEGLSGAVAGQTRSIHSDSTAFPILNQSVDYLKAPPIFNHMIELQTPRLDSVFHALGDATRRQMLRDLSRGERTVGQLAEPFAISLAAASKHIKALEKAGLIRREVRGRTHLCRLDPGPLSSAHEWLTFYERFWSDRLDVLEQLLREEDARQSPTRKGDDQ